MINLKIIHVMSLIEKPIDYAQLNNNEKASRSIWNATDFNISQIISYIRSQFLQVKHNDYFFNLILSKT